MRTKHGHVHWNELNTTDIGEAGAFYGAVLGWKIDEVSEGGTKGWLIRKDGDTVGGAFALDGPEFDGMMSHWFTLFAVSDIETAVADVPKAGGEVIRPPFTVPTAGTIAVVRDPTGAYCGLIQPEAGTAN